MILRFLHWLAANGWVYDSIQTACGVRGIYAHLENHIPRELAGKFVLDIGGGTGTVRRYWPADCHYICLDNEMPKLTKFRRKTPDGLALLADAARMPVATGSISAIVSTLFSHHLPEALLDTVLQECRRVLAPRGSFIFIDALDRPDRTISRLMWSLDRGSHPHSAEYFRKTFTRYFEIAHWERFTIYHEYVAMVLRRPAVLSI